MADLIVESELTGTRDGLTQLQRRWRSAEGDPQPRPTADGRPSPPTEPGRPRSAVLLVHGIGEHSGRYDHVGRHLAEHGHDVLAFDSRGHGQSGGRRGHVESFHQVLDDVEDLVVERRQVQAPVVLFGHSLGGLVAAAYAASDRPQPELLVLSAPALSAVVPRWQLLAAPLLSRVAPKMFIKRDLKGALLSVDPEVQRLYDDDPLRVPGATARFGQEILLAMADTTASLGRIKVPTYVLHGGADELVPPEVSQPLADLPLVTRRVWPGLRHEALNEPSWLDVLDDVEVWLDSALDTLPAVEERRSGQGRP